MMDLSKIPSDPGCYTFKDKENRIIYIGKAKNLKKRVASYFQKKDHDEKTKALVSNIADVEFFVTSNEVEALILENNLIKKHKPKYNIDLRESRRYAYIVVTNEEFPRLRVSREKNIDGKYFGPFVSGEIRENIRKILITTFQIRTCNKMPKKACLRYHIQLCSAPCINNISKEEYASNIKDAEYYLKGRGEELIKKLNEEMNDYSKKLLFEKAKIRRDQINSLESLYEKQKFELDKKYDEDIINYIISENTVYLIVFNINKGMLTTKNEFDFDYKEGFLEEFITQYYLDNDVPKEIILPHKLNDDAINDYLENIRESKVTITIPQKGDKYALLELVKRNIETSFLSENQMTNALRNELRLNSNPQVIECFDISNISGTLSVGAMVQFRNAKPDKNNYRRFKIKTVVGTDDFASIKEIVRRRYYGLRIRNETMPDLIVIDGGKGQLSAAQEALQELELKIPMISLAKKFEEIYAPGRNLPIILKKDSKALRLLVRIRDETHRFAITYHRLLRSKEMTK